MMKTFNPFRILFVVAFGLCTWSYAQTNIIITPVDALASDAFPGFGATNLINSTGLNGELGPPPTAVHSNAEGQPIYWLGNPPSVEGTTIEFDLGGVFDVERTHIWNFNEFGFTGDGIALFAVEGAGTNGVFNSIVPVTSVPPATGQSNYTAHSIDFNPVATNLTQIRFVVQSNHDGVTSNGGFVGLSEVRFEGVQVGGPVDPPTSPEFAFTNLFSPSAVVTSTNALSGSFVGTNMIDSSGLSGDIPDEVHGTTGPGTMWLTDQGPVAGTTIDFDLGGDFDLDGIRIWNYNEVATGFTNTALGARSVDVEVAGRDGVFNPVTTNMIIPRADGTGLYAGDEFDEVAADDVRQVRLIINDNHEDATTNNSFVGLSEIKFAGDQSFVATNIVTPVGVIVSSEAPTFLGSNTINGSGLSSGTLIPTPPEATHGNSGPGAMWLSDVSTNITTQFIQFDLGENHNITDFFVYNYNEVSGATQQFTGFGINQAVVEAAPAAVDGGATNFSAVGTVNFPQGTGATNQLGVYVRFPMTNVQHIRLNPLSTYANTNQVGLAEMRFVGRPSPAVTVPTLGEWGMIILAALLMGFGIRKIRREQALPAHR